MSVEIAASEVRLGDEFMFGRDDRRFIVGRIATNVATFYNPGRGIPHGALAFFWEGDTLYAAGFNVSPSRTVTVTKAEAVK